MASLRSRRHLKTFTGARGFVFPKYQPVAIHGDPIHPPKSPNPGSSPACSLPHHQHALSPITSMLSPSSPACSLPHHQHALSLVTSMLSPSSPACSPCPSPACSPGSSLKARCEVPRLPPAFFGAHKFKLFYKSQVSGAQAASGVFWGPII